VEGGGVPKVEFFTQRNSLAAAKVAAGAEWGDPRGLALLIVDTALPEGLAKLPIDTSAKLEGDEAIIVIGHPASGGSWAISRGTIASRQGRVLYFSATIDKGNSGGPLLREGKVVGVVTNKGPAFGEALEPASIAAFLTGSNIDTLATSNRSPSPSAPVTRPTESASAPPPTVPVQAKRSNQTIAEMTTGEVFTDCDDCPEMIVVPAGDFLMGSPESEQERNEDEGLERKVSIPRPLAIGRTEVTRGQFARFETETGYRADGGCRAWNATKSAWEHQQDKSWRDPGFPQTDQHPAVCVNWPDAKAYVEWLAEKTGKKYRLLSEAEWEYAARAGEQTVRYWGERFDPEGCKYANIADATAKKTHEEDRPYAECDDRHAFTAQVGSYEANKFGFRDMIGNAWEWTQDCWKNHGAPERRIDRRYCDIVVRGGSWQTHPRMSRAAGRIWESPGNRDNSVGLRVARTD
jgi:formylglycine-generating enzyme required for sulfatase activity